MLDRRALMLSGLASASAALAGCQTTPPLGAGVPVGAIRVDVSRLVELGWGANAAGIKVAMERELATLFGPALRRGAGPTLVVEIRGIWLASYAGTGGGGRFGGGGASNDSLDSIATLVEPGGRVLATYPILSTISSSSGGAWYLPDIDQRRIAALVANNALWIKRYVVG
ncbi:hypothetical protein [Bosea sp. BK604]|uniref:hypothetical protein n=1 Tax=Bosea sp. BK604 TaxID=2512180 RepID=UPI00104C26C7|nr:hypothetical protein [Bosea sp. BK604]TCR69771.1 hypothetical protein EV560_101169 [Bosea sp. BK604]